MLLSHLLSLATAPFSPLHQLIGASGKADDEDRDGGESDNNEGEGNFELDLFAKSDVDDIHDLDVEFSMCNDIQNYVCDSRCARGMGHSKIPKTAKVPNFVDVDNPDGWTNFPFHAKFTKDGKYKWHAMPAGTRPCPLNRDGVRVHGDWEFFYEGWKLELPGFISRLLIVAAKYVTPKTSREKAMLGRTVPSKALEAQKLQQ